MSRQFNPSRRSFLASASALMVSSLTGCASTGSREADALLRRAGEALGSGLVSDTVFSLFGIPNRLAFVSGRPLTDADMHTAGQARELFSSAGLQVQELPYDTRLFEFTSAARGAGTLKTTHRRRGAWEGRKSKRGAEQLAASKGALERYRGKTVLEVPDVLDIMAAHRPFFTALAAAQADREDPTDAPGLVVPAGAHATIPVRTGCLGAGLPLPRAGEGARLISVPAAVHPEQRAAVRGLLKLARRDPNQLKTAQLLIWNLIHADNSGYRKVFAADISGPYRDVLDQSVPGGWRRYQTLVERAHARRLAEEEKLRLAKLSVAQLNALTGCSFELVPPTRTPAGSAAFAEDILRQGQAAGLEDLRTLANDGLSIAARMGLQQIGTSQETRRAVTAAAKKGEITDVLLGPNSPFNPLQGYSMLAPGVGAHLRDIGGTSLKGELAIVNHSAEAFHFEPATLAAFTPRRTQAQQVEADYASPFVKSATGGKDGLSTAEEKLAESVVSALADFLKDKAIAGFDEKLMPGAARLLPRLPGLGALLSKVPVLGTAIGLHDLYSYTFGDGLNLAGEQMSAADAVITAIGLIPGGGTIAKTVLPAIAPLASALATEGGIPPGPVPLSGALKMANDLFVSGAAKQILPVTTAMLEYGSAYSKGQADVGALPGRLKDAFADTARDARMLGETVAADIVSKVAAAI